MHPDATEELIKELALKIRDLKPTVVIGPAMAG
jgi:orotate phosphoribosyltransferase